MSKPYSISFNLAQQVWLAKYKNSLGAWKQKRLPKSITSTQVLQADNYFSTWLLANQNGEASPKVVPVKKTLKLLVPKWLELRKADPGTKPNTYQGFITATRTWILDNEKFPHVSIENLDIEKELTVSVVRDWMNSLKGEYGSRLSWIRTLKTCINDCIQEEWLDPDMTNPLEKKVIKKMVGDMTKARAAAKEIYTIELAAWHSLLGSYTYKVSDMRKIRYLLSVLTGLRDGESAGLIWGDIHLEETIPYLKVERQLDKGGNGMARYEDLVKSGMSKDQIKNIKTALVSNPKYNSKRIIPLHPALVKALTYWKEVGWRKETGFLPTDNHPVFVKSLQNKKEGDVVGSFPDLCSAKLMKDDWKRANLEIGNITFHSWRRTFLTMLEMAGVEQSKRDELAGHKAKSVAASNYISKNLETSYLAVSKLPVPKELVLQKIAIQLA